MPAFRAWTRAAPGSCSRSCSFSLPEWCWVIPRPSAQHHFKKPSRFWSLLWVSMIINKYTQSGGQKLFSQAFLRTWSSGGSVYTEIQDCSGNPLAGVSKNGEFILWLWDCTVNSDSRNVASLKKAWNHKVECFQNSLSIFWSLLSFLLNRSAFSATLSRKQSEDSCLSGSNARFPGKELCLASQGQVTSPGPRWLGHFK